MICKYCGSEIGDDNLFCTECGKKLAPEISDVPETEIDEEIQDNQDFEKEKSGNKNKKIAKYILIVVAAIFAVGGTIYAYLNFFSSDARYEKYLELGQKYLLEENYEEAVVAFNKAIEIEPKNAEPEIGLAEAYAGLGDEEEAVAAIVRAAEKSEAYLDYKNNKQLIERINELAVRFSSEFDLSVPGIKTSLEKVLKPQISIDDVVTVSFPQVNVLVSCTDFLETPSKDDFIIKEDGQRKEVKQVMEVAGDTIMLSYVASDAERPNVSRGVEVRYITDEYECSESSRYVTPEPRDVNIFLEQIDATDYPTIRLYYRVEDPETGEIINGLSAEDFSLYENTAGGLSPIDIKNVMQLENKGALTVEIVSDISGSMSGNKMNSMKKAMKDFSDSLQYSIGDRMAIMCFDESVYKICDFSSSSNTVQTCINGISPGGSTAFYDAIMAAANDLMMQGGARCLIAFTDGIDNASEHSLEEAGSYIARYKLPLFIIGVEDGSEQDDLKKLADMTGGRYINISQIEDLGKIYNDIYTARKQLYLIEYETRVDIGQAQEREVKFELKKKGMFTGQAENAYVPVNAAIGESNVDVINLQSMLEEAAAKEEQLTSNLTIDYNMTIDFKSSNEYLEYLRQQLEGVEKLNDSAKDDVMAYIRYAIAALTKENIDAAKNEIVLSKDTVKNSYEESLKIKQEFLDLLEEKNISLDRNISIKQVFNVKNLDLKKPVKIILKENLPNVFEQDDEIQLVLGSRSRCFNLDIEDALAILNDGDFVVQLTYSDDSVKATFADSKNKVKEKIPGHIGLSLKADNALSTVFASYKGGSDNWGGQYDSNTASISFETKYSGEYSILEQELDIKDAAGLTPKMKEAVYFMVSKGYFTLTNDNFRPSEAFNRYEFTEALVKMFFSLDREEETSFSDVPKDDYYYDIVASAEKENLIEGYEDGKFKGSKAITKQEMLVICARTLVEKKGYEYPEDVERYLNFEDAGSIGKWAKADIALAVREGLINGEGILGPKDYVSRGESAEILYNMLMLLYETEPIDAYPEETVIQAAVEADSSLSFADIPKNVYLIACLGIAAGLIIICTLIIMRRKKLKQSNCENEMTDKRRKRYGS